MKNAELSIPSMQSAHCQASVNGAIKDIDGVKIEKLEAGKLYFSFESNDTIEVLVEAIAKAGYKVGDNSSNSSFFELRNRLLR